jgi:hypothetical protein
MSSIVRLLGLLLLVAVALAGGVVLGLTAPWSEGPEAGANDRVESDPRNVEGVTIRGVVVLDGSVNGCGGEEVLVHVRDATGVVARTVAPSSVEGFDCVHRFAVRTPRMRCYSVSIDRTPVGVYPHDALAPDFDIGYISSDSVWGPPGSGRADAYRDFNVAAEACV